MRSTEGRFSFRKKRCVMPTALSFFFFLQRVGCWVWRETTTTKERPTAPMGALPHPSWINSHGFVQHPRQLQSAPIKKKKKNGCKTRNKRFPLVSMEQPQQREGGERERTFPPPRPRPKEEEEKDSWHCQRRTTRWWICGNCVNWPLPREVTYPMHSVDKPGPNWFVPIKTWCSLDPSQ